MPSRLILPVFTIELLIESKSWPFPIPIMSLTSLPIQNEDKPELHSVQTTHSTYVISFFHKKIPIPQKLYIHTVPIGPNIHHTQSTKPEKSRR